MRHHQREASCRVRHMWPRSGCWRWQECSSDSTSRVERSVFEHDPGTFRSCTTPPAACAQQPCSRGWLASYDPIVTPILRSAGIQHAVCDVRHHLVFLVCEVSTTPRREVAQSSQLVLAANTHPVPAAPCATLPASPASTRRHRVSSSRGAGRGPESARCNADLVHYPSYTGRQPWGCPLLQAGEPPCCLDLSTITTYARHRINLLF